MSTITKEFAQDIIKGHGYGVAPSAVEALARMALAALDSEPVAWTDEEELRDVNVAGIGYLFGIDREANKFSDPRRQIMLYRHAQQPVVPDDVLDALQKVARIRLDLNNFDGDRSGIADCLGDAEEALIEVVNRRAAMLQSAENTESRCGIQTAPALDSSPKTADARCGNSSVIPDTWIPVSEQMPPSRHEVLVGRWWGEKPRWCCKWATYIPGHPDAQSSGWLIPGGSWTPTHWMELPAAPQEVKP